MRYLSSAVVTPSLSSTRIAGFFLNLHYLSIRLHRFFAPKVDFSKPSKRTERYCKSQIKCAIRVDESEGLKKTCVTSQAPSSHRHSRLHGLLVFSGICVTSQAVCSLSYVTSKVTLPLQRIAKKYERTKSDLRLLPPGPTYNLTW